MLASQSLAIRAASSRGAAWVLTIACLTASSACGQSSSSVVPSPQDGGHCHECGGEPATGDAPSGGASKGGEPSAGAPDESGGQAGAAEAGAGGTPALPAELTLSSLTISQTLEVPLMAAGRSVPSAARSVPLIAGKRGLLRAFVQIDPRFEPRPLLGVLDVRAAGREHSIVSERTISQASAQDDLTTTFVFDVPAEDLEAGSAYRVRVLERDTTPLARFPETSFADFQARELPPFRLVVVPYVTNGFTPKTTSVELEALRRRLVALFPSRDVEISVNAPVKLDYLVDADGAGWDDALDKIYELRADSAPSADTFYYGLLTPAASYDAYCPKGCMLGYSIVADVKAEDERASIGVGIFSDGSGGGDAEDTAAHELGHALGRDHAPCGISDPKDIDPDWPDDALHRNALIGAYGYDFELGRLLKPRPLKDVMSYCSPSWVSDYTYVGLFERLLAIASQPALQVQGAPQTLRVARIQRSGHSRWLAPRVRAGAPLGAAVEVLDANGRSVGKAPARFARVDHGRGGYVWLSEQGLRVSGAASVDLTPFGGGRLAL